MTTRLLLALALVGCSATVPETMPGDSADAGTTSTGGGGDPSPGSNTPPGGGVPDSITIAGQAIVQDQTTATPQSDVAIGIYATGNDTTPLATAMTDASGNYSLSVPTHGAPIDGYIKATKSGLVDTYVYPPTAMSADTSTATASMISTDNYSALTGIEGASSSKGMIILVVLDKSLNPISGATVSTTPSSGKEAYMNSSGEPFSSSSTYTDGLAFVFNVPTTGTVTVGANKAGSTFSTHAVTARAGKLTTTLVIAQ
jgi:hypothetical protein